MATQSGIEKVNKPRRRAKTVPTLHLVMIRMAAGGICLCGLAYYFATAEKAAFFARLAEWCMAFLFGKFTNGFGIKNVDGSDEGES